MDRYQLATLVKWAGTLHTRKRVQKVVYLLQAAGCPLDADYTLHHYGPYSHDVARLADAMVQADLLHEEAVPNVISGQSFSYQLSERAQDQLERLKNEPRLRQRLGELGQHESLARQLLEETDLRKLEYAATTAYFHNQKPGRSWQEAREAAARFKKQQPDSQVMRDAESFAREVLEQESPD
jgi:uncharacterized protein YwgA